MGGGGRPTETAPAPQPPSVPHSDSCHKLSDHEGHPSDHHHDFGRKTISFWGSCCLNFNNVTGPSIMVLPLLFQQAGWVLPISGLLAMYVFSSIAASMLTEAMQRIPGNKGFTRRYEYCTLVRHYYGKKWYALAQVGYNASLQASNIAAMIVTAQVLDAFVENMLGQSYALRYSVFPPELVQSRAQAGLLDADYVCKWGPSSSGGGCESSVISIGFLLAMAICIPFGKMNLEENMWFQWLSFWATMIFSVLFAAQFIGRSIPGTSSYCPGNGPSRTPAFGPSMGQVLGISVFFYSYVSTIPSWVNEKKTGVSVKRAIWLPAAVGLASALVIGLFGAWAYQFIDPRTGNPIEGTESIFNVLDGHSGPGTSCRVEHPSTPTLASVYLWALLGYIPGIPVLAIMVRYNLLSGGLVGSRGAFFWGVVAPWLVTAFCYERQVLATFCNWVAITCQGFVNCMGPPLLFRAALLRYPTLEEFRTRWEKANQAALVPAGEEAVDIIPATSTTPLLTDSQRTTPTRTPYGSNSPVQTPGSRTPNRPSRLSLGATPEYDSVHRGSVPELVSHRLEVSGEGKGWASWLSWFKGAAPSGDASCYSPIPNAPLLKGPKKLTSRWGRILPSGPPSPSLSFTYLTPSDGVELHPEEKPVGVVPSWVGVDPVLFASVMAGSLGVLTLVSVWTTLFLDS